jgi:hypothetical protein
MSQEGEVDLTPFRRRSTACWTARSSSSALRAGEAIRGPCGALLLRTGRRRARLAELAARTTLFKVSWLVAERPLAGYILMCLASGVKPCRPLWLGQEQRQDHRPVLLFGPVAYWRRMTRINARIPSTPTAEATTCDVERGGVPYWL